MSWRRWGLSVAVVGFAGPAGAVGDRLQGGLLGGLIPSEPLYTPLLLGGWVGVGLGDTWRLELQGSYLGSLVDRSAVGTFVANEGLLSADDAMNDRALWSAECLLRAEPLRGRLSILQGLEIDHRLHLGLGGGVRAFESTADRGWLAPLGVLAVGVDLLPIAWLRVRLDLRGHGYLRRDETVAFGAEFVLGVGGGL